jgi:nucleolar protein 15
MAKLVQDLGATRKRLRESAEEEAESLKKAKATPEVNVITASSNTKRKAKGGAKQNASKETSGEDVANVVYVGHIPKGFFETEMKKFFSQFGTVRRVKLYRSKKTGNSKGYAFVQFGSMEVAQVVAEAIDGYFLSDHQLVAHVVEKSKCHEGMFLPPKEKKIVNTNPKQISNDTIETEGKKIYEKVLRSDAKKLKKLRESGIDF